MLSFLRRFGKLGETLAWIVALIETKLTWAAALSVVVGIAAAWWTSLFELLSDRRTQVAIGAFLATLWTYIGLQVLRAMKRPTRVATEPEYKYCLNPEGYTLHIDPKGTDLALSVGFAFRNLCPGPIAIHVESFQIRIDDRTCGEPEHDIRMILPRVSVRTLRSGGFKKDVMAADRTSGILAVSIVYGPPEAPPVRRYKFKTKLQFGFSKDAKGQIESASVAEESFEEEESPLVA